VAKAVTVHARSHRIASHRIERSALSTAQDTVFLFDVDNTLLDNDAVVADLRAHLTAAFGAPSAERYWAGLEALRAELGYVDYLGALQRYRADSDNDPQLLSISLFVIDYPFRQRLYDGALQALAAVCARGPTVILSDGDVVFQPRKIERAGIWNAVEGRVLIYIHKEQMLDDLQRRYPAAHYVMVDDKLRILTAMKAVLRERLTTVFVRQGHYAHDLALIRDCPPADFTIEAIGELTRIDLASLAPAAP
jgi:FMN phosphatase YigB (HAD superfamily)